MSVCLQPYMVAVMTELLEPEAGDRVLEVGGAPLLVPLEKVDSIARRI